MPRTALKVDIRDITSKATRHRVAAIFIKHSGDKLYKRLTYMAGGVKIDDDAVLSAMRGKVDLAGLTADFDIPGKLLQ